MHHLLCLCLVALLAITAHAQTATVTDANGNTVVQVVTTNALGLPTTSIIQTVPPAGGLAPTTSGTSSLSSATGVTQTPATITSPATTTTNLPQKNTPPPAQQGPVGQPAAAPLVPGGVTPYTYITVINGETSTIVDNFTPTNPATQRPTVGAVGTILDYSQWLAQYGPPTSSGAANAAYTPPPSAAGWWGLLASGAMAVLGGLGLAVL